MTRAAIIANALGVADVFLFGAFLLPVSVGEDSDLPLLLGVNAALGLLVVAITFPLAASLGRRALHRNTAWLLAGRVPTDEERDAVLREPMTHAWISGAMWLGATVVFGVLDGLLVSPGIGLAVAVTTVLGGTTTSAMTYLVADRALRPITAAALAGGPPGQAVAPGVRARLTMAWALGTGVPVLGIVALALAAVLGADLEPEALGGAVAFLAAVALMVGLLATRLVADSVAAPLGAVRSALGRVEAGDLSAGVEVDDASEVGLVQVGLNRMVAGLRERERLRDLFGRQVGHDVAQAALEGDEVGLGGEEREVAILFVDVVGSTRLAARRPPAEVVALLNAFFAVVVDVVDAHDGWVNKFEGDGALCVFGAPAPDPLAAARALAAARELRARLAGELDEIDAAIGVSAGTAVAGNVGAEQRFEYTVLGDPVNEAARLCELAKQRPQRLVASDAAVARAGAAEARHWSLGDTVVLRGRDAPTRLATAAGRVAGH